MKAWVLEKIGKITSCDVNIPDIGQDEVLVKVKAAGICGSDIPRVFETGAHVMPLIPGHEFSGVVEKTGEIVSTELVGKQVGVYPLIPCGKCASCLNGHPETCREYNYLGSRCDGGFGEWVKVPAKNLKLLPDGVTFEQAAMLEPLAVAIHAVKQALTDDDKSKKVIVCGAGTIGLLMTAFLRSLGFADIVLVGNRENRRELALATGISKEEYILFKDAKATLSQSADVFFECVGKNECLSLGIECLKPGGKLVTVGNPASDMELTRNCYWKILRNQLTVIGTWNSTIAFGERSKNKDDWDLAIDLIASGKLHPEKLITHRLKFDELYDGLKMMRDKTEEYAKVMMIM